MPLQHVEYFVWMVHVPWNSLIEGWGSVLTRHAGLFPHSSACDLRDGRRGVVVDGACGVPVPLQLDRQRVGVPPGG